MFDIEEGKKAEQTPLQIRIGDVFEDPNGGINHLATRLDNDNNSFSSVDIYKTKGGKEALTVGGSSVTREFVRQVVDHWELDRVILALKEGITDFYFSNFSKLWNREKILDAIKTAQKTAIERLTIESKKTSIVLK